MELQRVVVSSLDHIFSDLIYSIAQLILCRVTQNLDGIPDTLADFIEFIEDN
jgi:hypothetical protein